MAAEAVEAARTAAGKWLSLEYSPPERPVEAAFDCEVIQSVASILLDSALEYTPEGGTR